MKKINLIPSIILSMIIGSCNSDQQQGTSPSKVAFEEFVKTTADDVLWGKAILGDTLAYNDLKRIYFQSGHEKEFLYYAIYMSDSNNFPHAYYDVYFILKTNENTVKDFKRNSVANYYLLRAYEFNVKAAKRAVTERFTGKLPSSMQYWAEIQREIVSHSSK